MANKWGKTGNRDRFYFLGLQNHCSDCSHEINRSLLLGRKAMANLDGIFKSRDITLLTKVRIVKPVVFPVVMHTCESWTIKKAEHWRTEAFELWCWERLKVGGEGDDWGWDGCMVSSTRWTWVWANSGSCWWPERPGVLQSVGSQRVRHNWATKLNGGIFWKTKKKVFFLNFEYFNCTHLTC